MKFTSFDALARSLIFPGERRNFKTTRERKPQGISDAYRQAREGLFRYVAYPSRRKAVPQPLPHAVAYSCAFYGAAYKH